MRMPFIRRTLVAALAATLLLAACAAGDDAADDEPTAAITLAVASYDLAVGDDRRFLAGLFTDERAVIVGGEVSIRFFYLGEDGTDEPMPVAETAQATFLPVPGKEPAGSPATPTPTAPADGAGVYETVVTFTEPGIHGVVVKARLEDGTLTQGSANFAVAAAPQVVDVGDTAPTTANNTVDSDAAAVTIDSRAQGDAPVIPDPELHTVQLGDAVADGDRPVVVVVSTPTYCVSQFCGPITDTIAELADRYDDRADFVHLEVWNDFQAAELNDAAAAWIQTSEGGAEPWVFYVDPDGTVVARWDNVLDEAALVDLLEDA